MSHQILIPNIYNLNINLGICFICFLQIIHDDERELSLSEEEDDEDDDEEGQGGNKNKEGWNQLMNCPFISNSYLYQCIFFWLLFSGGA